MEESLALKHCLELFVYPLEKLLDGRVVPNERGGHLESLGRDVAHGRLDVVGDPFHKVGAVLGLHLQYLLVHFLHGHLPTVHGSCREISTYSEKE